MPNEPAVSFGFEAFWSTSYDAFPRFWDVWPRLIDSINSLIAPEYPRTNGLQKVILNLGILGATTLSEIATLVGNGLGQGAMKITRSMLELAINAEFLRTFPEHLDDFFDWGAVEGYRLMQFARAESPHSMGEYPDEFQKGIEQDFQRVKHRFELPGTKSGKQPRIRTGWCSVALDARAAKTGFQDEYKLIYPIGNKLLHATIGGMAMHAQHPVARFCRIAVPPSLEYCKLALLGAHTCGVKIITTVSKVMNQEPSPTLDVLTRDYRFAWENNGLDLKELATSER